MRMILAVCFVLSSVFFSYAADNIGSVKKVSGDVSILRGSAAIKATAGMRLNEGDIVRTGDDASAGIIFKDSTVFSVGSKSEVLINKYMFEPKDDQYAFSLNMKKGTAVYESGRMGKLSPESVKIHTPKATIGVRGTKFMVEVTE